MRKSLIIHLFDLEKRTAAFTRSARVFAKVHINHPLCQNDIRQLLRASGSVAANYIEANESISPKDFTHRLKICRKESKECSLWLDLIGCANTEELLKNSLADESHQLLLIFNAIITKIESKRNSAIGD